MDLWTGYADSLDIIDPAHISMQVNRGARFLKSALAKWGVKSAILLGIKCTDDGSSLINW